MHSKNSYIFCYTGSSGHDSGSRERKPSSYGSLGNVSIAQTEMYMYFQRNFSLDRSWARRARSGSGNKKRPDLLNIDFGADRERNEKWICISEMKLQKN